MAQQNFEHKMFTIR